MKKGFIISAFALLVSATFAFAAENGVAPGIEKYVNYRNKPKSVAVPYYTPDGAAYLEMSGNKVVKYDIKSGKEIETVLDLQHTRENTIEDIDGFVMSPDGGKMLVWRDSKSIYRRSFTACYYVYELKSRILKPLSDKFSRQRAPLFSPDGRMVAFVADDNNIYIKKLDYNTEVAVTKDGKVNEIINGVPDWAYEEEFYSSCSMTWSPDNLVLCYLKYDESKVPVYGFTLYEGACDPMKQYALYPGSYDYKYPVAGIDPSVVTVNSYDVETRKTKTLSLDSRATYVPHIEFASSSERLMTVTLNRAQNRMEIFAVNPKSMVAKSVLVEESKGWIIPEAYENISFGPDDFVIFSGRSGHIHLYCYTYNGQMKRQLTRGDYDVTAYYGADAAGNRHFYQSTSTGVINRVVSSVDSKGVVKNLSPEKGEGSAWLTPKGDYYTIKYSNTTTPPAYTLYASAGDKKLRVLEDNKEYGAKYTDEPRREFFNFTTVDGVTLNGYIVKPLGFNASKKYPVVMYQYSGPGSQEVLDKWTVDWANYFARNGFIIMCVDGRGTGGRGTEFMYSVYKNLGHYETIDQAAAARYAASLPYVDGNRIGIYGWSFGGYETLMALTSGDFNYAAGVAVAPVTSWRYYDNIYTERYMLTPQENEEGYEESAPMNYVDRLTCPLLIMHGTADDNVHLSNTIEYVSALENAGKFCDMLLFPNMNHSIYGCSSREMVFSRMFYYFKNHLMDR